MEYFIVANSFAAPFCSDQSTGFIDAESPTSALETFAAGYKHPCGLYAAEVYASANAYHKSEKPLAKWLCNHEIAKQEATEGMSGYAYLGQGPGGFEIDGRRINVRDPKAGMVV